MLTFKKSSEQISFDLTHNNIEFQSREKMISPLQLEYSQSSIVSIKQNLIDEPFFSIKINHNGSKFEQQIEENDDKFLLKTPFQKSIHLTKLNQNQNLKKQSGFSVKLKPLKEIKKYRYNNITNKKLVCPILPKCLRINSHRQTKKSHNLIHNRSKTMPHTKFISRHLTQNQETDRISLRNKKTIVSARSQAKTHSLPSSTQMISSELMNSCLAKKLNLTPNEIQQKKYLQKVLLNRQSIMLNNQKGLFLPYI